MASKFVKLRKVGNCAVLRPAILNINYNNR